jgi:hypothetical protein
VAIDEEAIVRPRENSEGKRCGWVGGTCGDEIENGEGNNRVGIESRWESMKNLLVLWAGLLVQADDRKLKFVTSSVRNPLRMTQF